MAIEWGISEAAESGHVVERERETTSNPAYMDRSLLELVYPIGRS